MKLCNSLQDSAEKNKIKKLIQLFNLSNFPRFLLSFYSLFFLTDDKKNNLVFLDSLIRP